MVSIPVEIIAVGITLMSPIYYGLYLLNTQDTVSAVDRAQLTSNLNNVSEKLNMVADTLFTITNKINSCQFCNKRKAEVDVIEFEDENWRFRSK